MIEKPSFAKRLLHSTLALDFKKQSIDVEEVALCCPDLPVAFHGARVAVVADVHLPDQIVPIPRLLQCLREQHPDAIFLPGDLTNSYTRFDAEGLRELAQALAEIAPCFAVPGNHEWRLGREEAYGRILTDCGVCYMSDSYVDWERNGAALRLYGMGEQVPTAPSRPAVLLAHRPEHFPDYCAAGWEVVICGHAHGGHVRLGKRSLFAPDQGFAPPYTNGVYTQGKTRMVVSRGLGNSSVPWRINNPPHLPILTFTTQPTTKE